MCLALSAALGKKQRVCFWPYHKKTRKSSHLCLLRIIRKSEKLFLSKSYARGWFISLSYFSGHKMVRDFRKQEIGEISQPPLFSGRTRLWKVPHCQSCPFLFSTNEYHSLLNKAEVAINLLSEVNYGLGNTLLRVLIGVVSAK